MAMTPEGPARVIRPRPAARPWRVALTDCLAGALLFLVMGGIHFYLVLNGVGGMLGVLFVLNAVGALVLAIAIVVLRRRLLLVASVLSVRGAWRQSRGMSPVGRADRVGQR